ncbi:uncharacterized protein JCM6883_001346 [Sporobolomyces salmoneus]|uniref:uncharacterized protein n=1 Tax=Sporobolomyces salmoneus TaxID=183962 RepID=UPI0031781970
MSSTFITSTLSKNKDLTLDCLCPLSAQDRRSSSSSTNEKLPETLLLSSSEPLPPIASQSYTTMAFPSPFVDGNLSPSIPSSVTASTKRPSISPLQPCSTFASSSLPIDERRNINRSLRNCGFSSSPSTPAFPLSPLHSPSSPSSTKGSDLKLPDLEIPPLTPPATPLGLTSTKQLSPPPRSQSTSHFAPPPPANSTSSPQLRPRRQPLRCHNDEFTPSWVRGQGLEKEGYCSLCDDHEGRGKWLSLKDGSFWYHRTFVHGISSISGQPFAKPIETRVVVNADETLSALEGLCGTCSSWHSFETYRSTASDSLASSRTLWYRHAHSCHTQVPIPRPVSTPMLKTSKPIVVSATPFISLPIVSV